MLLLIDNYDSFTHNLAHLLALGWEEPVVARNDEIGPDDVLGMAPQALVLSPGPGRPRRAGRMMELLAHCAGRLPILGICLGHQGIGELLGLRLVRAPRPVHGHADMLEHSGEGLFAGCPSQMRAARYHSLVLEVECGGRLPREIQPGLWVDARCEGGLPMALREPRLGLWGLQYHPESFLSPDGLRQIRNFRLSALAWQPQAGASH